MGAFPANRSPMQPRIAEGTHDPLFVNALALSDKSTTLVICSADLLGFQWIDVDTMRNTFAEQSNLPPENLILCGTHNHNGPECTYHFGGSPEDDAIVQLRKLVVEAALEAISNLEPATVSTGFVDTDLVYNRRHILPDGSFVQLNRNEEKLPNGPVDPAVNILRFDKPNGHPITSVIHFAAHPVILATPNRLFTAEYPGATRHHFQIKTNVPASLFLQGACGNTHPFQALTNTYDSVEEMAKKLSTAAASAWTQATTETDLSLKVELWQAELPNRYTTDLTVRTEITAVRLSNQIALIFWQGEPFIELSLSLQWRSPFPHTIVVGHSQGSCGYVPTRQAYHYGGYGVAPYPNDPPEYNRACVAPGTGERWVEESGILLDRLHGYGMGIE